MSTDFKPYTYRGELPPISVLATVVETCFTSTKGSKAGKMARRLLHAEGFVADETTLDAARAVVRELDELDVALRNPNSPNTGYFDAEDED